MLAIGDPPVMLVRLLPPREPVRPARRPVAVRDDPSSRRPIDQWPEVWAVDPALSGLRLAAAAHPPRRLAHRPPLALALAL